MKSLDEILRTSREQSQKLRELTNCIEYMTKSKFTDTPTTAFAKNRAWLRSDNQVLRAAAIAWVKSHAVDLEIDYDESGNIIDFTEVQF